MSSVDLDAGQPANGEAAAALVAAGAGCCALGILAVLADGIPSLARGMTFYIPTGPLSGVSSTAILLWLALWFALARRWRNRNVALARTNAAAFLLLAIGILLTFPPIADLLLGK